MKTVSQGFTHAEDIDSAKNEGDHWMPGADVLAEAKYSTFDTRSGTAWREDYRFPFRVEWEKDQFDLGG